METELDEENLEKIKLQQVNLKGTGQKEAKVINSYWFI